MGNTKFQIGFWSSASVLASFASNVALLFINNYVLCNFTFIYANFQVLGTWALLNSSITSAGCIKMPSLSLLEKILLGICFLFTIVLDIETFRRSSIRTYALVHAAPLLFPYFKADFLVQIGIFVAVILETYKGLEFDTMYPLIYIPFSIATNKLFEFYCRKQKIGSNTLLVTILPYSFIASAFIATFTEMNDFFRFQFPILGIVSLVIGIFIAICQHITAFATVNHASSETYYVADAVKSSLLVTVLPLIFDSAREIEKKEVIITWASFVALLVLVLIYIAIRNSRIPPECPAEVKQVDAEKNKCSDTEIGEAVQSDSESASQPIVRNVVKPKEE